MARLVALGDSHLGRTHLAHIRDEEGRNTREEDFLRSFIWAVDETIRLEPDGFVWLGDIFDHARPTYRMFAQVVEGLQRLANAGLKGAAISGNHDTPRVRGTGSPYDALERMFPSVSFAWRMEAVTSELAGVVIHAVPQTLTDDDLREQLEAASQRIRADAVNLMLAHVALTSLPARAYRDINELEVEEAAFDRKFDLVVLGHYHEHQKASKRTWYAGSTDTFSFADSPQTEKGLLVLDTDAYAVEHVANPHERPLVTFSVQAGGMGPSELVEATEGAARGSPEGAIVRVYLNDVEPSSYRQVPREAFAEAVPGALYVQPEAEFGAETYALQGGPEIVSLEQEWVTYVEGQELAGLDRGKVVETGRRFLDDAKDEVL
jgi:DNA repair exonuclease SbcCD nuclease subunit